MAFWLGAALGICVLLIRRYVPESPRWLLTHGRTEEAEETTDMIEEQVRQQTGRDLPPAEGGPIIVEQRESIGFGVIFKAMFQMYPKRTILGLTLMGSQAFLYNAIFFTYALVLTKFYGIDSSNVPYYIFPFAIGNVLGPWLLGRFFDTIGRVPMISGCYFISGPVIFGQLIGTANVTNLFIAYLLSAGLMIFAAVIELVLGVRAEGQSLENVATPLTAI